MKNKKGFTLIEVLITIAVILSISIVAIVSIKKISEKQKENAKKKVDSQIVSAANQYFENNQYLKEVLTNDASGYICLSKLVNEGYLNSVTDPQTGKKYVENTAVEFTYTDGKIKFSDTFDTDNCENKGISFNQDKTTTSQDKTTTDKQKEIKKPEINLSFVDNNDNIIEPVYDNWYNTKGKLKIELKGDKLKEYQINGETTIINEEKTIDKELNDDYKYNYTVKLTNQNDDTTEKNIEINIDTTPPTVDLDINNSNVESYYLLKNGEDIKNKYNTIKWINGSSIWINQTEKRNKILFNMYDNGGSGLKTISRITNPAGHAENYIEKDDYLGVNGESTTYVFPDEDKFVKTSISYYLNLFNDQTTNEDINPSGHLHDGYRKFKIIVSDMIGNSTEKEIIYKVDTYLPKVYASRPITTICPGTIGYANYMPNGIENKSSNVNGKNNTYCFKETFSAYDELSELNKVYNYAHEGKEDSGNEESIFTYDNYSFEEKDNQGNIIYHGWTVLNNDKLYKSISYDKDTKEIKLNVINLNDNSESIEKPLKNNNYGYADLNYEYQKKYGDGTNEAKNKDYDIGTSVSRKKYLGFDRYLINNGLTSNYFSTNYKIYRYGYKNQDPNYDNWIGVNTLNGIFNYTIAVDKAGNASKYRSKRSSYSLCAKYIKYMGFTLDDFGKENNKYKCMNLCPKTGDCKDATK